MSPMLRAFVCVAVLLEQGRTDGRADNEGYHYSKKDDRGYCREERGPANACRARQSCSPARAASLSPYTARVGWGGEGFGLPTAASPGAVMVILSLAAGKILREDA